MPPPPHSKEEALRAVPVVNSCIETKLLAGGQVQISYPLFLSPWLTRLLPHTAFRPTRTLELDSMGTFTWNLIDGDKSVQDIADIVAKHFNFHPVEGRNAVVTFIRQLGQRGIIGLR
jgi:hypothetical protein